MEEVLTRVALFTALPLLLGAAIATLDRSAVGPVRRAEAFLIPLFLVGIGGGGVAGFIGHVFISDPTASSIGWAPGSPFQLQLGFAVLAIGLLGAIAAERRDGFREATVAAVTVFSVGTAVVHLIDTAPTGNFALANALQNVANLAISAALVWLLLAERRAERMDPPNVVLRSWMVPVRRGSVVAVAIAAAAFAGGNATGQPVLLSVAGIALAAGAFWWIVSRAPSHRAVGA